MSTDIGPIDVPKCKCPCEHCTETNPKPYAMVLFCPRCRRQHIDEGEFATKPHRVHRCVELVCDTPGCAESPQHAEHFHDRVRGFCPAHEPGGHDCGASCLELLTQRRGCGFEWQPALVYTVGVEGIL